MYASIVLPLPPTAATIDGAKDTMRANSGDPKMLPPQFFRGEKHLGGYDAFELAIEDEELDVSANSFIFN